MLQGKAWLATLFCFGLLLIQGCSRGQHQFDGLIMGTTYHVTVVDAIDEARLEQLKTDVHAKLVAIDKSMSTYKSDSELMQLNRFPVGQAMSISDELMNVMIVAREIFELSGRTFDPTVGELVDLWGFGQTRRPDDFIPDDDSIQLARGRTGFDNLILNPPLGTAARTRDIQIDLSAVAKGYAVDKVAEMLESRGIENYLVEIGGEIRVLGHSPRGDAWRTAIAKPEATLTRTAIDAVELDSGAVATSGDYYNFFEVDGKRYSHTIDPRTGYPATHILASVTVVDRTAARADALATAIAVLGPDQGMRLAERINLPIYVMTKAADGYDIAMSPAFKRYLIAKP